MLFGYGKFGNNLYETLYKRYKNILIIDEHPAIISHLKSKDIDCMYGDVGDNEFLDELDVKGTKMIISTVKKFDENMVLLETIKKDHPHIIVILLSNHVQEAIKLYEQGADYVILPHYI
ncbi:MAG: NAD(P)-binding protein [bacterium]